MVVFLGSQNSKCQVQAKFQWGGGGYSWIVKTQSAKSWPNFNFWGEGGWWYSWVLKTQSAKFRPNFNLGELEGGLFLGSQNSKVPSPGQIHWGGGGIG